MGYIQRSADARSYSKSVFNFVRNRQLSSQWPHHLASHQPWVRVPVAPCPHQCLESQPLWVFTMCCGISFGDDTWCCVPFDLLIWRPYIFSQVSVKIIYSFLLKIFILLEKHFPGDKPWNVRAERWTELNGSPDRVCNYLTCPSQVVSLILPQMGSKNNCVVSLRLKLEKAFLGTAWTGGPRLGPSQTEPCSSAVASWEPPSTTLCTCPSGPLAGSLSDHADAQNCGSSLVPLPLAHWEPQTSHRQSQTSSGVSSSRNLL